MYSIHAFRFLQSMLRSYRTV